MDTIFSVAARVATPLALAGLTVSVVYGLYARVFRPKVIEQLDKHYVFRVVDTGMQYIYHLAMVAIVLGVLAFVVVNVFPASRQDPATGGLRDSRESLLELVDVSLAPAREVQDSSALGTVTREDESLGRAYTALALDIKLRNRGMVSTFLKRAEIEVLESTTLYRCGQPSAVPVSYTYDLDLADPRPFPISQEVRAGGVDRFRIRLYDSRLRGLEQPAFRLRLVVVADEDDKKLISKEFSILLPPKEHFVALAQDESDDLCIQQWNSTVHRLRTWPTAYSLPRIVREK
jgi:hypothetical protein